MGSTGTGRFSDYPGTPSGSTKGNGGQGGGGKDELDRCERAVMDAPLEEISRSAYFTANRALPPVGTPVAVRERLVGGRIGVETVDGNEVIGLLPTEYNYMLQCMKRGYKYSGRVRSISPRPVPLVRVELEPAT